MLTTETTLQPLARETLADQVYQVIIRYILRTGAEPGSRLPSERKFCEMLAVSRKVVRAALDQLAEDGYVEKRAGVGIVLLRRPPQIAPDDGFDLDADQTSLEDLYQARIALEVGAIEWVVPGLTEEDFARLDQLVDQIAVHVAEGTPFVEEDRAFHLTLIQACANPAIIQLASIIDRYFDRIRATQPVHASSRPQLERLDVRHRMIVTALRTRDVEAARQALRLHFLPWPKEVMSLYS